MLANGHNITTITIDEDAKGVSIIDQRKLPFELVMESITTPQEMAIAIKDMHLRGAPLIGVAAAYGLYLGVLQAEANSNTTIITDSYTLLANSRPTAVNLKWALDKMMKAIGKTESLRDKVKISLDLANSIREDDINMCKQIGQNGVTIIEKLYNEKKRPINILTHCNAGALATVDYGTATSPMYFSKELDIPIHVWVEETRPRNQGRLTSWELSQAGIPNTIICDNAGGHLMQHGKVGLVIVGADRVTSNGDVANKIGTYLKGLAAFDNQVPFFVAIPESTVDFSLDDGLNQIPIEERNSDEVLSIEGKSDGQTVTVQLFCDECTASNYAFDITPSRLVTGFITDRGVCKPDKLAALYGC